MLQSGVPPCSTLRAWITTVRAAVPRNAEAPGVEVHHEEGSPAF